VLFGLRRAGEDHQAAGLAVQAVYRPHPPRGALPGNLALAINRGNTSASVG